MNRHLNGKTLASAAVIAAAAAALGAAAVVRKKRRNANSDSPLPPYPHTAGMEGLENIEPGELSPKVDTPTDPATQN